MAIKWIALLLLLGGVVGAEAQVINAASCSQADVQTAFNSISASTTTVNIPACSGGVGWSNQVSLTVPSGSTTLSILGAGSLSSQGGGDATVIIDNYASSNAILIISTAGQSSFLRLAGITFQGGSGAAKWNGIVNIQGLSQNVRVDHSHFNTQTYSPSVASSSLQFNGCLYGVTDHSIFDNPAGSVNNSFRAYNAGSCNNDALGVGDQSWAAPTGLGSANFMFAENNTFNNGAGNDCTQGGRYVWRYNTMNMTSPAPAVQTHPTGGAGRIRGCRAWEIYNNTATAQSSNYINAFFWVSSGTGVVWGNTLPSSATGGGTGYRSLINANVMRATNQTYTQTATPNGWGYCGSTPLGGVPGPSNWDENLSGQNGYPCLDQIGRGQGDLLVGGFSADGSGSNNVTNSATGCNSSQSCAWPRQALEPIYEWADAYSPVPNNPSGIWYANEGVSEQTQNQDYYLGTTNSGTPISFNGTSGVGSGTLSSRPSTCAPMVAYWATDTNTLYQCSSTNTWTAYYTPYTYPHPLTQGDPQSPQAPTGLQAVVN